MTDQTFPIPEDLAPEAPENHRAGWVVLIGPPNAGKSTLMNGCLGQKVAITSPKPQTTRNRISGILTEEGTQIVFLDTPGIHRRRGKMNGLLLKTAWQSLASGDVIVVVLDAQLYAQKPGLLERDIEPAESQIKDSGRPILVALNKIDRVKDKKHLLPVIEAVSARFPEAEFIPVSALTGAGQTELLTRVRELLPVCPPIFPEDQISTVPVRFMASEIIREKLFMSLQEELPYSTAVSVDVWDEDPVTGFTRIEAVIVVGRESHKPIVIGNRGENVKKIGQQARKEIEELLQCRIYLGLVVRVRRDWTEDVRFLHALGLGNQELM